MTDSASVTPTPESATAEGEAAASSNGSHTSTAVVTTLDDLAEDSMKMVHVGETRVAVIRTSTGVYAIDNACPHQGYGLTTGSLSGDTLTCLWHNWKYDVTTGRCLIGEEDVPCHTVKIDDRGEITVDVTLPTAEEERERLWPSLRRGLADNYVGQMARDTVRLLDAGATAPQIMAEALALAAPKADYGVGHEMAMAADCLALSEVRTGDDRILPLVQGLSGMSETSRDRTPNAVPPGDPSVNLVAAIEDEDLAGAMSSVIGQIEAGVTSDAIRHQFVEAVSAHHLGYGHGIIYTQKSFELLDRIGWEHAGDLLPHLAARIVNSTREDTLPYMRKAMRAIEQVDLHELTSAPDHRETGWSDEQAFRRLLAATDAPIDDAVALVRDGAGIEGLLNTISEAVSHRLLHHDLAVEFDSSHNFGWLDITHGLTTARAVRWAWRADPGPHAARLALFATWLLFDTGRSERRRDVADRWLGQTAPLEERFGEQTGQNPQRDMTTAVRERRADNAVALCLGSNREAVGEGLAAAALEDRAGSFIVMAHLIKTAQAAREEAEVLGSPVPMAAAARFLASPRLERFVARNVAESIDFIRTGRPPRR